MTSWRSAPELKSVLADAGWAVLRTPLSGQRFVVDEVLAHGEAADRIRIRSTLHFHERASPYCCGEPDCHLGTRFSPRIGLIVEHVRCALGREIAPAIEFEEIQVTYHPGATYVINGAARPLGAKGADISDD